MAVVRNEVLSTIYDIKFDIHIGGMMDSDRQNHSIVSSQMPSAPVGRGRFGPKSTIMSAGLPWWVQSVKYFYVNSAPGGPDGYKILNSMPLMGTKC